MYVVKAAHVGFPCLAVAGGRLDEALYCLFSGRLDKLTEVTNVRSFFSYFNVHFKLGNYVKWKQSGYL